MKKKYISINELINDAYIDTELKTFIYNTCFYDLTEEEYLTNAYTNGDYIYNFTFNVLKTIVFTLDIECSNRFYFSVNTSYDLMYTIINKFYELNSLAQYRA